MVEEGDDVMLVEDNTEEEGVVLVEGDDESNASR
jgi:hypothetical protein